MIGGVTQSGILEQPVYAGNKMHRGKGVGTDNSNNSMTKSGVGRISGSDKPIVLHANKDAREGEECVGAWASVQTGISTSVYKPADFSEDNPYYRVKIWKDDGEVEERMVDVKNFNPESADNFEQYAFACYLEKEEGMPVITFALGEGVDTPDQLYEKRDWIQAYKDRMQQQYDVKYYEGYFRYKKVYERLMEQMLEITGKKL